MVVQLMYRLTLEEELSQSQAIVLAWFKTAAGQPNSDLNQIL
jgi:hypothetical protein